MMEVLYLSKAKTHIRQRIQTVCVASTHTRVYNRLTFDIASAPAIFQRLMDIIIQGISNVVYYIDNILVTGKDD